VSFLIDTPRCIIRAWNPERDRAGLMRMTSDVEMMRYITGGETWDDARVDGLFARQARSLAAHGVCIGALCRREDGEIVGIVGVQPLDVLDGFDLGWWIWREYWNRGLATEAAIAACDDAFGRAGLQRLYACIDPDNHASQAVARKLGMRGIGRMKASETGSWRGDDVVEVYELTGADWTTQRRR
jgi:[ribosomal protein S5]-alanine N-acetyltransferase